MNEKVSHRTGVIDGDAMCHVVIDLPPADTLDPVIEVYKKDVDRSLLRENLQLSIAERLQKFQSFLESLDGWMGAAHRSSRGPRQP